MADKDPTAAILTVGDEVLRGDTVDTNKAFLGAELTRQGVAVPLAVSVPDRVEIVADWVRRLSGDYDFVFSCGGIGPTPDDLTREAIGLAFNRALVVFERELAEFEQRHGVKLNPGQREMWRLPLGSELVWGEGVTAPGFRVENVYAFAGVPVVMEAMWRSVADRFQGTPLHVARFESHARESLFAPVMTQFIKRYPQLQFGSYPRLVGGWRVMITVRGVEPELVERIAAEFRSQIEALADRTGA
jgi:molybdenum cofactor synthesis domain-containing protein